MPQDRDIDVVLDKALGVLGHAEFFEPVRNLLHCGTAAGDSFGHNAALQLQQLAGSRLSWVAACSGAPFHGRHPLAQDKDQASF
jgi:hypothetical protein